jgi:hypothetical protein
MSEKVDSAQPESEPRYQVRVIDNGRWEMKMGFADNYFAEAMKCLLTFADKPAAYVLDRETGVRHTVEEAETLIRQLPS